MQTDMAKIRRESLRWLILLTLNNARPVGAYEGRSSRSHRASTPTPHRWRSVASWTTWPTVTW